jgi:hypothetical protein
MKALEENRTSKNDLEHLIDFAITILQTKREIRKRRTPNRTAYFDDIKQK